MRAVNSFIEYFIASDATLKSKPHRLERLKWSNSATKNKIKEQTNQTGQGCTQVVGLLPTRKHIHPNPVVCGSHTCVVYPPKKREKEAVIVVLLCSFSLMMVPTWLLASILRAALLYNTLYGWDWDAFSGWYVP